MFDEKWCFCLCSVTSGCYWLLARSKGILDHITGRMSYLDSHEKPQQTVLYAVLRRCLGQHYSFVC